MTAKAQAHFSDDEIETLFTIVKSDCESYKNWIATAVENDEMTSAKEYVKELRGRQSIYARINGVRRERRLGEWARLED